GYVGVDVFFVISGYLITRLIRAAPDRSLGVSLLVFYERRARRILPALTAMLASASMVACVILLPTDLCKYGKFMAATSIFLSNVAAWSETGYFDGASNHPLLHLWS